MRNSVLSIGIGGCTFMLVTRFKPTVVTYPVGINKGLLE